jgi:UDP-N-acetylmuramate: L-alanyl-gamma-D-glutamyl-meso-diaminopimelate ligase
MPKDFFAVDRCTALDRVKAGGRIHVIGVCGVAMAQLAVELSRKGYAVSGSDKEFYEPMAALLRSSSVSTLTGYDAAHVPLEADLVVIGNAISYGNPEVDVVEQKGLPYTCFPKILAESLIAGKHSVVVTGTHGKSTTTAIAASMLVSMQLDPSYFVGGIAQSLPHSLHWGDGAHSVVEGDEYDSAFFAKVPKFSFYRPDTAIINAIEFDHADIYPNVEAIELEFTKMVIGLPAESLALCCVDFERVARLVQEWRKSAQCRIITFGQNSDSDVRLVSRRQTGLSQECRMESAEFGAIDFSVPVPGAYNAKNAMAALLVAKTRGLQMQAALRGVAEFRPVKRRQEIRFEGDGVVLIEDFAHHPTAVSETIAAIREVYPDKKLWAIFEPRSNTSRRKVFQEEYVRAFLQADNAVLSEVTARGNDASAELIDVPQLASEIAAAGTLAACLPDAATIADYVLAGTTNSDVILLMSNGSFGGLPALLEERLRKRAKTRSRSDPD